MARSKVAFVLSGGASLGAVQVGMIRALIERGVEPDLIVGNSVGALNGAWLAGREKNESVNELADIWRSLKRSDVFPLHPLQGLLGFAGKKNHLVSADGLRRLIEKNVRFARLEDATTPLHLVATEVNTGNEVLISQGETVEAILASAAIPGVFPPVLIQGRELMDGGIINNTPISHAAALGAGKIYVLPTGYACDLKRAPQSALGMVLHAVTLLIEQRLILDIARYESDLELHVIPPLCPLSVSPADFSRSRYLIDKAYKDSSRWLSQRTARKSQAGLLAFHRHKGQQGPARV